MEKMPDIQKEKPALNGGITVNRFSRINPFQFSKKGTHAKAIIALVMVCFFWGTTWVASKQGVKHMPALQLAGIRQSIGGLCYVLFFAIKGFPFPKGKEWVTIVIL